MVELEPILPGVTRWLADEPKKLLIGGRWVESTSGKSFETLNPADGQVPARVYEADSVDVDRAVKAARKAFDEGPWPRMRPNARARLIWRLADLIEAHREELAQLETKV